MTHHRHDPADVHPSPAVAWSLLRMSALGRLVAALAVAAIRWAAVFWAMS
jgi:hypothetical protein